MVTLLVLALLSPLLVSNLTFVAEAFAGLSRSRPKAWPNTDQRCAIIIPAHDEAKVIAKTLERLVAAADDNLQILVVADNCRDETAGLARGFPVQVIQRSDASLRGKGFALAFARDHLRSAPPASVIVLDADCRTDRESLRALAGACQQLGRPVQAINLLEPAPTAGPLVQLSSFAFLVKNLVRQRGLQRIAGKVHLTGTGMALPWRLFDQADLATSSIVEDVRLGIEMGARGIPPTLVENSRVWSPHAQQANTLDQRSRWEGGFLALARRAAPALIGEGLRTGSPRTLFAGLDLMVPPLVLLALANLAALIVVAMLSALGATSWLPLLLLGSVGAIAVLALLLAWWTEGRAFLSAGALARLPLYMLWKIPMYLRLARSGAPQNWNRTERPSETGHEAAPPNG